MDEQLTIAQCLGELRDKARILQETGICIPLDYNCKVVYSDRCLSLDFASSLDIAVSVLENVQDRDKDWHPGSDHQVLDLVHPSLYPLIYGRSKAMKHGKVDLEDCVSYTGKGDVVRTRSTGHLSRFLKPSMYDTFSQKFQWLPCDVVITDKNRVRIASYINNLHPAHHKPLYSLIETAIAASIPLWDTVLESVEQELYWQPRMPIPQDIYQLPDGKPIIKRRCLFTIRHQNHH